LHFLSSFTLSEISGELGLLLTVLEKKDEIQKASEWFHPPPLIVGITT
jgi:hypothetical protein